jgi:hypothetical protein
MFNTIPMIDDSRTRISRTDHPVLDQNGLCRGHAPNARAARDVLNGRAVTLCKINGAMVFADPSCRTNANWSRNRV